MIFHRSMTSPDVTLAPPERAAQFAKDRGHVSMFCQHCGAESEIVVVHRVTKKCVCQKCARLDAPMKGGAR